MIDAFFVFDDVMIECDSSGFVVFVFLFSIKYDRIVSVVCVCVCWCYDSMT